MRRVSPVFSRTRAGVDLSASPASRDFRFSGSPRYRNDSRVKKRGFTLLEVMIALLVITLGMGAVMSTTSESGWKSTYLKQKTIASWVAFNQIALYRAKRTWNSDTSSEGEAEMANVDWVWKMEVSETDDPSLRRLDIEVFLKGEDAVKARATGFIGDL